MEFGPVQVLVVGFEDPNFSGAVVEELRRLSEHKVIRLVDLLVVNKTKEGDLETVEVTGLTDEEGLELGAKIGALIGFGAADEEGAEAGAEVGAEMAASALEDGFFSEGDRLDIAESIPPGSAAAVALIEHRWAIPLRDAIIQANGVPLEDAWIHPLDLVAIGVASRAETEPVA